MDKVWLVWKGEYSEKDVVAVAQTETIAKKLAEIYSFGRYKPKVYVTEVSFASDENVKFNKAFYVERNDGKTEVMEINSIEYVEKYYFGDFDIVYDYGYDYEVWVKANDQEEAIAKAEALFDAMDKSKGGQNEVQVQCSESV